MLLAGMVLITLIIVFGTLWIGKSANQDSKDVALTDNAGTMLEIWKDRRLADGNVLKTKGNGTTLRPGRGVLLTDSMRGR